MFVIPDGPSGPIRNPGACGERAAPGFRVSLSLARNDSPLPSGEGEGGGENSWSKTKLSEIAFVGSLGFPLGFQITAQRPTPYPLPARGGGDSRSV